jgi:putative Holliday junction resolvase
LGVDLGEKRIGLAVSDPTRTIASAYQIMKRRSRREDFARYEKIVATEKITLLVMGLPVPLSGVEGQRAAWVRDYSADLSRNLPIPIVFWDESFSSKRAESALHAQGYRGQKVKDRVDAVAAAIILQSYLDAQAEGR